MRGHPPQREATGHNVEDSPRESESSVVSGPETIIVRALAYTTTPTPPLWRWLLLPTAALGSIALTWGFTVDDALISTRVAHHLNTLGKHAFNPDGPSVDCVTPLGWALLLSPFAGKGAWEGLEAARWFGAACTLATAWVVTLLFIRHRQAHTPWHVMLPAAGLWLGNLPLGAWASSGMETPVVMLLCTLATWGLVEHKAWGYGCAGVAAALRPELMPWALVQGVGTSGLVLFAQPEGNTQRKSAWFGLALVFLPPVVVALCRVVIFGTAMPLAVLAKPSDASSGLAYVRGGLTLLGIPMLLWGFRSWKKSSAELRVVGLSLAAHVCALVAAGGDWMSLFRLFIPVLPSMLWLGAIVTAQQDWRVQLVKYALAFVPTVVLHINLGPTSSHVMNARRELVTALQPLVKESRNVASLDVGWVGAASPGNITDLAGVTDPEIAVLPGGHTSKKLPLNLLDRRSVDTLVLLLSPNHAPVEEGHGLASLNFARVVENRVARLDGAESFRVVTTLPLGGTTQHYVVLTRKP